MVSLGLPQDIIISLGYPQLARQQIGLLVDDYLKEGVTAYAFATLGHRRWIGGEEIVYATCQLVNIHEKVSRSEHGYQSDISTFTKEERRRLNLVQLIIWGYPVWILDGGIGVLQGEDESSLQATLLRVFAERTILIME